MILDVDGQALLAVTHRWALGHRTALEDAVHLQAEVVVEAPGGMFLDDEKPAPRRAPPAEGLGRPRGIALGPVRVERPGTRAHTIPRP